jgi:nucleoid-associated protein YgaU
MKNRTLRTDWKPAVLAVCRKIHLKRTLGSFFPLLCVLLVLSAGCNRSENHSAPFKNPKDLKSIPYRPLSELMPEPDARPLSVSRPLEAGPSAAMNPSEREFKAHQGQMVHQVRAGENLFALSRMYYGDARYWRLIFEQNRELLRKQADLQAGQRLYLPLAPRKEAPAQTRKSLHQPDFYLIAPGDQLGQIAEWLLGEKSLWPQLIERNKTLIKNPDEIRPGMVLRIREDS